MNIFIDIDGVLTNETKGFDYENRTPNYQNIGKVNELYRQGHTITLYTSRYLIDKDKTEIWMKKYNVKYHTVIFNKPKYDIFIDDKCYNNLNQIPK